MFCKYKEIEKTPLDNKNRFQHFAEITTLTLEIHSK
jgi:hypothetical protein